MSRVRRKEGPKTHSRILRKLYQNSKILKPQQIGSIEQVSITWAETAFLSSIDAAVEPTIEF